MYGFYFKDEIDRQHLMKMGELGKISQTDNWAARGSDNQTAELPDSQEADGWTDGQPDGQRAAHAPAPAAPQTFRVLVLAVVVHSEDEGLQDEGDDDRHHHLAGHRQRG